MDKQYRKNLFPLDAQTQTQKFIYLVGLHARFKLIRQMDSGNTIVVKRDGYAAEKKLDSGHEYARSTVEKTLEYDESKNKWVDNSTGKEYEIRYNVGEEEQSSRGGMHTKRRRRRRNNRRRKSRRSNI